MTAEFAVALPAIALVLAACLGAVQLAAQQVRLTDAAADAARALGRGEDAGRARTIASHVAGDVAIEVSHDGDIVCALLSSSGAGLLAAVRLEARSCALGGGL
ncbi:TadE family type IV pilus minor pilin [Agromyces sp. H3Y2-19a]|uniref:TadE family type IV pilus minor pilin n=1 Tax=Agromyces TaxID=33877 RepID=UPI001E5DFC55|nr:MULTISPECIES: TadE family type IV pilus minor pilin [Agromyces]MCD5347896.1 hypothetical protein [Agromyces sp. S2-1-8]MDF0514518.1 TadE family type IV pilus minor pilin [Agromyces chromiiresistens]